MSKLSEKIAEVQAAAQVLQPYVDMERYVAYLNGLIDARQLEVDERIEKSFRETTNE